MNRLLALLPVWLAALLLALAASAAHAQDYPPRPDGPVYDGANILSPATEAQLDQQLRAYNRETGRAIIVATVPSLGGPRSRPMQPRSTPTSGGSAGRSAMRACCC